MTNLEKVRIFLGQERFQRVLDVLKAFGLSLPNNFEIYSVSRSYFERLEICKDNLDEEENYHDYAIILKESEHPLEFEQKDFSVIEGLPKIKFSDDEVEITVEKDGILYEWFKEKECETIRCTNTETDGELEISFKTFDDGIKTSELECERYFYPITYFLSEITEVQITKRINSEKTENKNFPIKEYYKVLEEYLNSDEYKQYIPKELNKAEVLSTILRVLKGAIDDLVYKLENENQNWRFTKELEKIEKEHKDALISADVDYQNTINSAKAKLEDATSEANQTKETKIRRLIQKQEKYNK